VIAPPAPFPFLRPGNQKASKQVRSHVQPKSKKPNQNLYSNQCACSPVDSNHKDLHRQRENRLQNSSAASSTTTTTTTNTSNATTPRAATSSCSRPRCNATGNKVWKEKPIPNKTLTSSASTKLLFAKFLRKKKKEKRVFFFSDGARTEEV
jgi:hypothetical protein